MSTFFHRPVSWRGLAGLALFLTVSTGCGSEAPSGDAEELGVPLPQGFEARDGWHISVAAEIGEKVGGCVIGDVDPDRVGDELVLVGESGRIQLLAYQAGAWSLEVIGQAPGEMIQVAVGDVHELIAGLEIVVVGIARGKEDDGGEGAAHLLTRGADGWKMEEIHRSPALLHAVCVTDLNDAPGDEIVVAGFSQEAIMLVRDEGGWAPAILGSLGGAAKTAVPYQGGFAVGCTDGSTTVFKLEDDTWQQRVVDQASAGVARLSTDDERLLTARDDGVLALISGERRDEVYRESDKLRGSVIANVDPTSRGLELATAGYGGVLSILRTDGTSWTPVTVYEDTDRFHHVASGVFGSVAPGVFLVACGYSGRVIVVGRGNP